MIALCRSPPQKYCICTRLSTLNVPGGGDLGAPRARVGVGSKEVAWARKMVPYPPSKGSAVWALG